MSGFKYLASPYSDSDPAVMEQRFLMTEQALNFLLRRKIWTYSPIVHCHALALKYNLPKDAAYWRDFDRTMIRASSGLILLKLAGWEISKGMAEEIAYAEELGLPIEEL